MSDHVDPPECSFDKWAENYDDSIASDDGCFGRYDDVLDAVVEAARVQPGMRVLDIGVGTANLALRCVARGADVIGLDPSAGMLARARDKVDRDVSLQLIQSAQPFLSTGYPDDTFDAVVSTYAFHHMGHETKPDAVREMARVLKPGGVIAIGDLIFEDARAEQEALQKYDWLDEEPFSRLDELRAEFSRLGMTLDCHQFTPVSWVIHATGVRQL